MKKISIIILFGFLLSACSTPSSGTMSCMSKNEQEQMTSSVTMKFEYKDNKVVSQENITEINTKTSDAYEQLKVLVGTTQNVFQSITGASYNVELEDEKQIIKESITIDFSKISKEDKDKIISYDGGDEMNIDDIKNALQSQSYTCEK